MGVQKVVGKDLVPSVKEVRAHLVGMNGHSLVRGNGRPKHVVDLSDFLMNIRDPGIKSLGTHISALVDAVRSNVVDPEAAKIELMSYRLLLELKVLDDAKKA